MYDESSLCRYGTPLPALEADAVPAKKPVPIQDQIVTDENGKRRFHGAFTGGFSAGYWNTVGSQEGWTPQSFKSSRAEKAEQRQQLRPEDFMDEEDKGQFGIAPQRVQPREEYAIDEGPAAGARKRKFAQPGLNSGPIPGVPVLQQLLTPVADKIAVRILKSMGWRPGQGMGRRQTRREKKRTRARNKREMYLLQHYGCSAEDGLKASTIQDSEDDDDSECSDDDDDGITYAPDDYAPLLIAPKDDKFGLGYTGLSREPVLSKGSIATTSTAQHINLFGPLEVLSKDKKNKLSITGQAFGVGALEEEDDDIYERDDMSKYDFSLEDRKAPRKKVAPHVQDRNIIDGYVADTDKDRYKPEVFRVELPPGWKPRNWAVRKSRFEPLDAEKEHELNLTADFRRCGLGRHDLNPEQRGNILGEETNVDADADEEMPMTSKQAAARAASIKPPESDKPQRVANKSSAQERTKALLDLISARSDNFTRGGVITTEGEEKIEPAAQESTEEMIAAVQQENQALLAKAGNKTKSLASIPSSSGGFKPFLNNESKQQRYEQFLEANLQDEQEISAFLATVQPVHLSEWDREREKMEFIQARKIYKPLGGIMSDRFVAETTVAAEEKVLPEPQETAKDPTEKKVIMERTKTMWKPAALLCKRYNIAEPYGGKMQEDKSQSSRKAKLSVFDYLESSINTKANFQTPVIIPKQIERPKAIVKDTERSETIKFLETTAAPHAPELEKVQTPIQTPAQTLDQTPVQPPVQPPASSKPNKSIEKSLQYVPKTELEKLNIASINKHPAEKVELFRAIFEDSDEDEAIAAKLINKKQQPTELNQAVNIDEPVPTLPKPVSAAAANLLRNTSPPRGIFAALFTSTTAKKEPPANKKSAEAIQKLDSQKIKSPETFPKISFKSRAERLKENREESETIEAIEPNSDTYGPKIPAHIQKSTTTVAEIPMSDVDNKLFRLLGKQKSSSKYNIAEEWIEKSELGNETSTDSSSDSSSSSNSDDATSSSKVKKKSKKSKNKKHKELRVRKHKKKDKKKSKKRGKSSHKSKKSKKAS